MINNKTPAMEPFQYIAQGNTALRLKDYDLALAMYEAALVAMPELQQIVEFNIHNLRKNRYLDESKHGEEQKLEDAVASQKAEKKLPITVLIITWDVGHNPLGRSFMLAEVVQRIARHALLIGFQFPRYGDAIWEPVRDGQLPVISLPGASIPDFYESLEKIASRIKPDVVIACKPRLPSIALGLMIKEKWGCPLIVDIDDYELSFFKDQRELSLDQLEAFPIGMNSKEVEPYGELWTRLSQTLYKSADEVIVSNVALQKKFGGTIIPHVRDENTFDPTKYNKSDMRRRYGVPIDAKIVLFFGTPRIHKGVEVLARAVSEIREINFRLLIVGQAPDRSVITNLDKMANGRVIYLPNQAFAVIPEILAMADVVCLPQDERHPISEFQLPAKAIDAVAMGVPLLVNNTPPLMQLVTDEVAELVCVEEIPAALVRLSAGVEEADAWSKKVRKKFLNRYSYSAAGRQLREMILKSLDANNIKKASGISRLKEISYHALGLVHTEIKKICQPGLDIVLFWKQNDTCLYGRRHDMVIKYLSSRPDVRKVIVFDAPISEFELARYQVYKNNDQNRWIYVGAYEKLFGKKDTDKISYNVFIYPPGIYCTSQSEAHKPDLITGYLPYVDEVLKREGVVANNSVFWIYPKNFFALALVKKFEPWKVVVDVVDDHRTWPGLAKVEKDRLTSNYREILAYADVAIANCESVQRSMREFCPQIQLIQNGCDTTPPQEVPRNSEDFVAFRKWSGKTIGYIGNLESKIDIELLSKLAEHFSTCQIVLIGSTHSNPEVLKLKRHANVRMPGVVPYNQAASWVAHFDVGILPHLNTELTRNMNPLKAFVYLALNVPVVSTAIENIERNSEMVRIAVNHEEFILLVEAALSEGRPEVNLGTSYARLNSWEKRLSGVVDNLFKDE